MFDFLSIAIQKSAVLLTASVIGVMAPLFQLQHETPVVSQTTLQIPQTKFLPEASLSMDEIAISSGSAITAASGSEAKYLPEVKFKFGASSKAAAQPKKIVQSKPATATAAAPKVSSVSSKISTPQDALNATSFFLNQRTDGEYVVSLHMNGGTGSGLDWKLYDTSIGGTASVPKMDVAYSCSPQWNNPPSNSSDPNPTFDLNASYSCDITMTDSLMRTATKKISFQTGMGRLLIKSSNLGTALKSGSDANGFVFDNQSDSKITVTGMTFDIRFKALNVSSPIVVRFVSPNNEAVYVDFPVQNAAVDAADSNSRYAAGLNASLSFSINPHSQRLLGVELFGIQQLLTAGVNPEFKVVLQEISTDNSGLKKVFLSPAITWSCIPFDPTKSLTGVPDEQNCK